MENINIPLVEILNKSDIDSEIISLIGTALDKIYYVDSTLLGDSISGFYYLHLKVAEFIFIELPLIKDLGLVIGNGDIIINTYFDEGNFTSYIRIEVMKLRLPQKWIKPVFLNDQNEFVVKDNDFFEISVPFGLIIENEFKINIENPADSNLTSLNFPYFSIGNTGIIVQILDFQLDLSDSENILPATIDGRSSRFKGIYLSQTEIILPSTLKKLPNQDNIKIIGQNLLIGSEGGVSGTIGFENSTDRLNTKLGNWSLTLSSFDLTFKQNVIIASNIHAKLKIPQFKNSNNGDLEIDVLCHLSENGDFNLTAALNPGLNANLFNFVHFNFNSFEIGRQEGDFYLGTSCEIWFENATMQKIIGDQRIVLPKVRVYSNGNFEIVGGTTFIPTNISLNLGPVEMAVSGIHFGSHEQGGRQYNYWGFDGATSHVA